MSSIFPTGPKNEVSTASPRPVGRGDFAVRPLLINVIRQTATLLPEVKLQPVEVNGGPGALFLDPQHRLIGVWGIDIVEGQITSIDAMVNLDKLTDLGPVGDSKSLLKYAGTSLSEDRH